MKKKQLFYILSMLLIITFSHPAQAIKITFGTKCHPDGNGACVGDRGVCLIIEIKKNQALARYADPSGFLGDDMAYGEMTMSTNGLIRLDVLSQNSDVPLEEHFTIEEPVILSEELSRDFGYREVTLLPGVYSVDYGAFRLGSVQLPVSVR